MGEFNLGSGEIPNPLCSKKHSLRLRLSRIQTNGRGKTVILLVLLKVLLLVLITLTYWLEKEQKK